MTRWLALLLVVATLGCTDEDAPAMDPPSDSDPIIDALDATTPDTTTPDTTTPDVTGLDAKGDVDAVVDVTRDTGCDAICYWDCPYYPPFRCVGGVVWARFTHSEPCHCMGDPWPYPGPVCTEPSPEGTCPSGACRAGGFDAGDPPPRETGPDYWLNYCEPIDAGDSG